jgi:hypothetical protein
MAKQSRRCPLCQLREQAAISDEARIRDVSEDTWRLIAKGARILAEERRVREAASMARYHDVLETCA